MRQKRTPLRVRAGSHTGIWGDVYEPTSRSLLVGDFDAALTDTLDFGLAGRWLSSPRLRKSRPSSSHVKSERTDPRRTL